MPGYSYFCNAMLATGGHCGAELSGKGAACKVCSAAPEASAGPPPMAPAMLGDAVMLPPPPSTKPEVVDVKHEDLHGETETVIDSPAAKKKHK